MQSLLSPSCWLVIALPWTAPPEAPMAEAALAFPPAVVPAAMVSEQAHGVLQFARGWAARGKTRVVWFSDLTRDLTRSGKSWAEAGIDWESVVEELAGPRLPAPALFLTLSQRAHGIVCDSSAEGLTFFYPDGRKEQVTESERHQVHQALEETLDRDWPPYIQRLIDQGRIRTS